MTYPRYSQLFPSLEKVREELENSYMGNQHSVELEAMRLLKLDPSKAKRYLTDYGVECAQNMLSHWKQLGEYLIVKYNDQAVKPEKDGKFTLTPDGLGETPDRPGFSNEYKKIIIKTTGDKYLMP